jgi:hypothetical protein
MRPPVGQANESAKTERRVDRMKIFPTRRAWKRIAIGIALVVGLLLIGNATVAWQANRKLESKRAELRAAGLPASIAELAPRPIPDEANAATHLARIKPRLDQFSKEYSQFYKTDLGKAWSEREDTRHPPTPEQAAAIRALLDAYPDILAAFEKAAACDAYASRLDFTLPHSRFLESLIDHQSDVRMVARMVRLHATLLIADRRQDEAVKFGTQLLKLGRLYDNEPTMVNYLISVAVRGYAIDFLNHAIRSAAANNSIGDASRDRLLAELQTQDQSALRKALQSEWALVLDYPAGEVGARQGIPIQLSWPITNWALGEADALETALNAADRPYYEVRDQFGEAAKNKKEPALLLPAVHAAFQAEARRLALVRSLRILVALDTYRQRNGKEASGMADLTLPPEAVVDPHSGNALKLKRTDDGWVIYSVMENATDDGGDFTDLKDWGLAPPKPIDSPN